MPTSTDAVATARTPTPDSMTESAPPRASDVTLTPVRAAPRDGDGAPSPTGVTSRARRRHHLTARLILLAALALVVAGVVFALRPTPLSVDVATASVGPMRVTVDADAVTRVRQSFEIAAPVSGLVQRLVLRPGDSVRAGDPVASIATPPLFQTEQRAVEARVDAALAERLQFDTRLVQAELALAQALRDEARARRLFDAGAIAQRDLELATLTTATRRAELGTVQAQRRVAVAQLAQARAALDAAVGQGTATTLVRAPGAGRVLSVPQRSARVVAAGAPLLEVGDPDALEVAADVLSSDAASVRPGQQVILRGWGGAPLGGVVRVVEPSARTRISALGVEEQRLTVIIDPSPVPKTLGDGYRLDASIAVWEGRALTVPAGALLRDGDAWAVFVVREGRALRRRVDIGHVGSGVAEVRRGLASGDQVVLFPPDALRDGDRVRDAH